jgi:hypothetical protein
MLLISALMAAFMALYVQDLEFEYYEEPFEPDDAIALNPDGTLPEDLA